MRQREQRLASQMGAWRPADRDVVDLRAADTGFGEDGPDRHRRKPGVVLDAPESLFFDGRDEHPVAQERGRDVAVVCVDA